MKTDLEKLESELTFDPLIPEVASPGGMTGPQLMYSCRPAGGKKAPQLALSFRPDVVEEMQLAHGDHLRLDFDGAKGIARLQVLEFACPTGASRPARVASTGRAFWCLLRRGEVERRFPKGNRVELEVIGVRPFAVFFKLPSVLRNSAPEIAPIKPEGSAWGKSKL